MTSPIESPGKDVINLKTEAEIMSGASDSEDNEEAKPQQYRLTDRRRVQNAKFKSWLSKRAEKATEDVIKAVVSKVDDETLPIRSLIAKGESAAVITDPREYQIELFERAKIQNIIAVLDTGSGKTLIAVLLLRHIIDQELEDRAMGKRHRISFFLVDSVTLVFQQHAVLECNLDQMIDRFYGNMNCHLRQKEVWREHFAKNMVIVCTAEVLYQCLMHSFIHIDEINLLIFDEAHHAKGNHPYARIMKDFFLMQSDPSRRPRVFGMTASPVDAKVDHVQAARELEALLQCQIATTANLQLLRNSISRPDESVAVYSSLVPGYDTNLCKNLKARFEQMESLKKLFQLARDATSQLGEWCADQVWSFGLADEEANRKSERAIEKGFISEKQARPVEVLDAELARLHEAQELVKKHRFAPPSASNNGISSKVILLRAYLNLEFEKPTKSKCIVFVKRRATARLLACLFASIGTPHLRPGILTGSRSYDAGDLRITFREQVVTLLKFRKGELNCLFATSIAEEGLDIPDCNLIVRFDLYDTMIKYIQSRGRARHAHSKYIHMIEHGNRVHRDEVKAVLDNEGIMRNFCEALPADRLLQGNDIDLEAALAKERLQRTFTDPETGATLTYASSVVVLNHFVGCLPRSIETIPQTTYIMTVERKQYVCEVILPENSPLHSAAGRPSSRRAIAKRSAAFEACVLLRKGGHLDSNLLPAFHKYLPAMRNAHLALNMRKSNAYEMRIKPDFWRRFRGSTPDQLFISVLKLESPESLSRPPQPLAILTREPLPQFPSFPLYLSTGKVSNISCTRFKDAWRVNALDMEKLTNFTLRIFKDVFAKVYEINIPQMSYWLGPVSQSLEPRDLPQSLLDWGILDFVKENDELPWTIDTPHSQLASKFLVDRWDGGRRFFTEDVVPELTALDPVPSDSAPGKNMLNILDYSVSLFAKSRARATWRHDQPVIRARRILHRRNWLDEIDEKEKVMKTLCYVCPEPLRFSALPVGIAVMSYMFPAILWRLESYLIALEACSMLGLNVKADFALEAVTKDSDNTDEHKETQIHFQRGMGKNYERLEFIGDCFLKMATSISLFTQNPDNDEYEYHVRRMLLLCNKNLFDTALRIRLYEYIRSISFSRRAWYPEGLKLLEGKGYKKVGPEVHKHHLGDKTIADVCEAIIGAALLSHGDSKEMDMAVKAVSVFVASPDHDVSKFEDYYKMYTKPKYMLTAASASQLDLAEKVKQKHDYIFRYPRLLRSAFIHPSYPFAWEKVPCYQRLEFLGDSLLDMACVNFLFDRFPDRDPQWLTEHKMAMVSNKFLGALCARLGFHKHLRANGTLIEYQVREYVTEVMEAEAESEGARNYWTIVKNPPKCLPDIVEAYIGALFVDSEFSYAEVERFFDAHIRWFFEDMSIYDTFANNHPTTYLNHLLSEQFHCTNYRLMAHELPSVDGSPLRNVAVVMIHDEVISDGEASSGKNAKVKASSNAIRLLDGIATYEYRERYRCDCSTNHGEGKNLSPSTEEIVGSAI